MIIYTLILFIFIIFYQKYTQKIEHISVRTFAGNMAESMAEKIKTKRLLKKGNPDKIIKNSDSSVMAIDKMKEIAKELKPKIKELEALKKKGTISSTDTKVLAKLKTNQGALENDIDKLKKVSESAEFDAFDKVKAISNNRLIDVDKKKWISSGKMKRNWKTTAAVVTTGGVATATGIQMAVTGDSMKDALQTVTGELRENALEPVAEVGAEIAKIGVVVAAETTASVLKAGVNASGGLIDAVGSGVGSIFGAFGLSGMGGLGSFGVIIMGIVIYFVFTKSTGTSESSANMLLY